MYSYEVTIDGGKSVSFHSFRRAALFAYETSNPDAHIRIEPLANVSAKFDGTREELLEVISGNDW